METLIIIEGDRIYKCGGTQVVGSEWTVNNDLRMQICCSCLSGIYIYKKIDFDLFRYALSRMRSREMVIQKNPHKAPVFVSFDGVWIGGEQVVDRSKQEDIDMALLELKWNEYWRGK